MLDCDVVVFVSYTRGILTFDTSIAVIPSNKSISQNSSSRSTPVCVDHESAMTFCCAEFHLNQTFELALSSAHIKSALARRKIASLIGIEGYVIS